MAGVSTRSGRLRDWNTVTELLAGVLSAPSLAGRLTADYRVWQIWDDVVGPDLAREAQPSKIRLGKLYVTVSSSIRLQEFQFVKHRVRDQLNERLAERVVTDILCFPGTVDPPRSRAFPVPCYVSEVCVPPLGESRLQAAFARLAAAQRRRALDKSGRS